MTIVHQVVWPKRAETDAVTPRDINTFWHMSADSDDSDTVLDKSEYTGDFGTYHGLRGYYANTGGRSNTTTRLDDIHERQRISF